MTESHRCPSTWALERFILTERGDSPQEAALDEALSAHIRTCSKCQHEVTRRIALGDAYERSPRATELKRRLLRAENGTKGAPRRLFGAVLAAAFMASLLGGVVLVWNIREPNSGHQAGDLLPKGETGLSLWRGSEATEPVLSGTRITVGTRLQAVYSSTEPGYLAMFIVDPSGDVVKLFPAEQDRAARVEPGPSKAVGPSFRPDDEIGDYTVVSLFDEQPFDLGEAPRQLLLKHPSERQKRHELTFTVERQ